eukprot:CAMPEP_0113880598 /NCGR_PEP_ID=MMETSP0780_2-20120614/7879_1 /TAXON_ID=652834 /ORGANISM="Palpitomonas bilix" /LENGTH=431 /DNA_ID=CAMNT_0000867301 /DNA_START=281 /DNA_END=1576 /DNA_ORIENTATION=+ /assembly_acc=CAM_ASM_000599
MTHPTKAVAPILLEDFRRVMEAKPGDSAAFTEKMIADCMKKVRGVGLNEVVRVDEDIECKAYYAGHVLGAAMFYIRVGGESLLYTGDFNMSGDQHLGCASCEELNVDVLITESTYGTTVRDSRRQREREFLGSIHEAIERGGKVLLPVFALGRAQELCLLLEQYWDRMGLTTPIYFSGGLTSRATEYYRSFLTWTNEKVQGSAESRNMFDFHHIKPFDRNLMDVPTSMVVFATPGMLHAGLSLELFKLYAPDPKNLVIVPGYCVAGTVGHKIMTGRAKTLEIDGRTVDVKCQVKYMSFSAHADAKGIVRLIEIVKPKSVMLVHGERSRMAFLKKKIETEFEITCFDPPNGVAVLIRSFPSFHFDGGDARSMWRKRKRSEDGRAEGKGGEAQSTSDWLQPTHVVRSSMTGGRAEALPLRKYVSTSRFQRLFA